MTREVHDIPPAPRRVRWRAVLWRWWPVAFFGFVLAVYGGLITLMLFLAQTGKPSDDRTLDRLCVLTNRGLVVSVDILYGRPPRVHYDFQVETRSGGSYRQSGFCFLPGGETLKEGDRVQVEHAPDQPSISRIKGGRIGILPPLLSYSFHGSFVPGVALLMVWFGAVLRLRRLMTRGDVAVGEVLAFRLVRVVLPLMYTVEYRFRDHNAKVHQTWHWVRARSELGDRLRTNLERIGVVHDRRGRGVSRLVMASDFAPVNTKATVPQETA